MVKNNTYSVFFVVVNRKNIKVLQENTFSVFLFNSFKFNNPVFLDISMQLIGKFTRNFSMKIVYTPFLCI